MTGRELTRRYPRTMYEVRLANLPRGTPGPIDSGTGRDRGLAPQLLASTNRRRIPMYRYRPKMPLTPARLLPPIAAGGASRRRR